MAKPTSILMRVTRIDEFRISDRGAPGVRFTIAGDGNEIALITTLQQAPRIGDEFVVTITPRSEAS